MRWSRLLPAFALLAFGVADGNKAPPPRKLEVNGHRVKIPGAWLTCVEAKDCAWVRAPCVDLETGVGAAHADAVRKRFVDACKGNHTGWLTVLKTSPPPCEAGVCGEAENSLGDFFGGKKKQ